MTDAAFEQIKAFHRTILESGGKFLYKCPEYLILRRI